MFFFGGGYGPSPAAPSDDAPRPARRLRTATNERGCSSCPIPGLLACLPPHLAHYALREILELIKIKLPASPPTIRRWTRSPPALQPGRRVHRRLSRQPQGRFGRQRAAFSGIPGIGASRYDNGNHIIKQGVKAWDRLESEDQYSVQLSYGRVCFTSRRIRGFLRRIKRPPAAGCITVSGKGIG
jgi:hypothetical protein